MSKIHPEKTLYAALDMSGRPLCLLPIEEISRQKLRHRAVAVLLADKRKKALLAAEAGGECGFTFEEALPAGLGAMEFAEKRAHEIWRIERLAPLAIIQPRAESGWTLASIFLAPVSIGFADMLARDREKYLLADSAEISALLNFGHSFSPLFRLFFQGGYFNLVK